MSGTKEEGEGPMGRTKEPWHMFLQTGLLGYEDMLDHVAT